jgi:tetratricopeptide (TPR) repeat protein
MMLFSRALLATVMVSLPFSAIAAPQKKTAAPGTTMSDSEKCKWWTVTGSQKSDGIDACNRIIQSGKASVDDYVNRGNYLRGRGNYIAATADYDKALQLNPRSANALNAKANLESNRGDCHAAIDLYTKALAIEKNPYYLGNRAGCYMLKNDYDSALRDANEEIDLVKDSTDINVSASAYNSRGMIYFRKSNFALAIEDFNTALIKNKTNFIAQQNRAFAYLKMGRERDALASLDDYVKDGGESALKIRGDFLQQQLHRYDLAIADYTMAINSETRSTPITFELYSNRANAEYVKDDFNPALQDINKSLEEPNSAWNRYFALGNIQAALKHYPQAVEAYTSALSKADLPNARGTVLYWRGLAYRGAGDFSRAMTDFGGALELFPKDGSPLLGEGLVELDKGNYSKAIALFDKAEAAGRKDSEIKFSRGLAYEQSGIIDKANDEYRRAIQDADFQKENVDAARKARQHLAVNEAPPVDSGTAPAPVLKTETTPNPAKESAPKERRVALIIGNSAYEKVPALPNPSTDAKLVGETLKTIGFDSVTVRTDLRREELLSALKDFAYQANGADWALVFYAGHGMEVAGVNYIIPIDARIQVDRDISFEAVALDQVMNAVERAKKLHLVLLDACRDNPFKNVMKRTMTVASRSTAAGGLAPIEPEAGTLVVYAAKDGETASDGDGLDSPFTKAFVKDVQTPGLEVRRLFDFVRDDVMDATLRQQKPFSYGSISGRQDFYFVDK